MKELNKFKYTLTNRCGVKQGDRILVALSGGVDSMLLVSYLLLLRDELGLTVSLFHLDHMYRGAASFDDYKFVDNFAKSNGLKIYKYRRNVKQLAEQEKQSFELRARTLRYDMLNNISKIDGYDYIATAHHKNDSAESIFMHFVRGSSLKGLIGLKYQACKIIRPLLDYTKKEIYQLAEQHAVSYREDYTNQQDIYRRNKIRNVVIPSIEELNPDFVSTITGAGLVIEKDNNFIENYLKMNFSRFVEIRPNDVIIKTNDFLNYELDILPRVIIMIFNFYGVQTDIYKHMIFEIESLVRAGRSGSRKIFHGISFEFQKIGLICQKVDTDITKEQVFQLGRVFHNDMVLESFYFEDVNGSYSEKVAMLNDKNVFLLDAEYLDKVLIRTRLAEDYISQKGLTGRKKLKKLFSELKLSNETRKKIPLLAIGSEVLWVVGLRKGIKHYEAVTKLKMLHNNEISVSKKFIIIHTKPLL